MLIAGLALTTLLGTATAAAPRIAENWQELTPAPLAERAVTGDWYVQFAGYGSVDVVADDDVGRALQLRPKTSVRPDETHAALVTSLTALADFEATAAMKTAEQLRAKPNAAETAWLLWHYEDSKHFYYFILKPNGWELGKEDPAYPGAQRFLASGPQPKLTVGAFNRVRVAQRSATISVWVDDRPVTTFTDLERPYFIGSIGLYCEDARVRFGAIEAHDL